MCATRVTAAELSNSLIGRGLKTARLRIKMKEKQNKYELKSQRRKNTTNGLLPRNSDKMQNNHSKWCIRRSIKQYETVVRSWNRLETRQQRAAQEIGNNCNHVSALENKNINSLNNGNYCYLPALTTNSRVDFHN